MLPKDREHAKSGNILMDFSLGNKEDADAVDPPAEDDGLVMPHSSITELVISEH